MQEQEVDGLPEAVEQLEEDNSHDLYLSQCRCITLSVNLSNCGYLSKQIGL